MSIFRHVPRWRNFVVRRGCAFLKIKKVKIKKVKKSMVQGKRNQQKNVRVPISDTRSK